MSVACQHIATHLSGSGRSDEKIRNGTRSLELAILCRLPCGGIRDNCDLTKAVMYQQRALKQAAGQQDNAALE